MPEPDDLLQYVMYGVFALVAVSVLHAIWKGIRGSRDAKLAREKQEALFKATFPELQPYFHPEKVLQFVNAWRARGATPPDFEWNNPPGLGFAKARFGPAGEKGRPVELLDGGEAVVSRWLLQDQPDGAVIRLGAGKLTVNLRDAAVRYWHPQREFKWSRLKGWRLINAISERPIESSDRGTSFSSDSPSSSSATSAAAAAAGAAVVTGAGGAFDGGGTSESWDAGSADSSGSESRTAY